MKLIILLSVIALVASDETYSTENDNVDIEAIVNNVDTLKSYFQCFMDKGSCDAVQADFKKDLPEAVHEACSKCTPKQKHILKKFLEGLKEKLPQNYEEFKKKFDSEGKYFQPLETAIANA